MTGNVQFIEVHPFILHYLVVLLLEDFKIAEYHPYTERDLEE
jgi:hypothetical protein